MRQNATLKTWLLTHSISFMADLFTVTLVDGSTIYRWTSWATDLLVSAQTYRTGGANGPLLKRVLLSQKRNSVDTLDVPMIGGTFLVGGKSLPQLAQQGYFDGARLQVERLVMPSPGDVSLGVIPKYFEGTIDRAEPTAAAVVLRCKSGLADLNSPVPRFGLNPTCGNAVYDANCGLVRATFTLAGTVSASSSTTITTASAALTAKAAGYFNLGVLTFTSGALAGTQRAIRSWSGTVFTLERPLPSLPANGDAISVYPGCARSKTDCNTKFANLGQHRSFPHIPKVEGGA